MSLPTCNYFSHLAQTYQQLLSQLTPCWDCKAELEAQLQELRYSFVRSLQQVQRPPHSKKQDTQRAVGLNSIGLLLDRLTILSIKGWCLAERESDTGQAKQMYEHQTMDIIQALAEALPARTLLNSKLTIHQPLVKAKTWEAAAYDLLATNILIWKAQEPLYCKTKAEAAQLFQTYTYLFPEINLQRDVLIHQCERFYWMSEPGSGLIIGKSQSPLREALPQTGGFCR